jgi:hypothetical protein
MTLRRILVPLVGVLSVSFAACAQPVVPRVTTLENPVTDPLLAGAFGRKLDAWGQRLIIGADGEDIDGLPIGAAYLVRRAADGRFVPDGRLTPPPGDPALTRASGFALDVAIDGDWAVVGAPYADGAAPESGAAFVYRRTGPGAWSFMQRLDAPAGADGDLFGAAVDIAGAVIVVGATDAGGGDFRRGRAYVFERAPGDVWTTGVELIPSDADAAFEFGTSVATDGDTVVVGDVRTNNSSAYVFRPGAGGWSETARLSPNPTITRTNVGRAVAVSGDLVLVGAPNGRLDPTTIGGAFLYRLDGAGDAALEATLGFQGQSAAGLGAYVRLEDNVASVGMRVDFNRGGPVALFAPDGAGAWTLRLSLSPDDRENFPQDLAFAPPLVFGGDFTPTDERIVMVYDVAQFIALPIGVTPLPDLNDDGVVDGADLGALLGAWGPATP